MKVRHEIFQGTEEAEQVVQWRVVLREGLPTMQFTRSGGQIWQSLVAVSDRDSASGKAYLARFYQATGDLFELNASSSICTTKELTHAKGDNHER